MTVNRGRHTSTPPTGKVGWVVTREWAQVTIGEGIYHWRLYVELPDELHQIAEGFASTRLGVRWQTWRARRAAGLTGQINARGVLDG